MLKKVISILGFITIIYLISNVINTDRLINVVSGIKLNFLIIGIFLAVLSTLLAALRFKFYLISNKLFYDFKSCWKAVLFGIFFNVILPFRGGDFIKCYFLDKSNFSKIIGVSIIERIIDIMILTFLCFIGSIIISSLRFISISLIVLLSIFLIFFFLLYIQKKGYVKSKKCELFFSAIKLSVSRKSYLTIASLCSVSIWVINCSIMYLNLLAVGLDVRIEKVFSVWPLCIFSGLLPISISGLGTRDSAFVYFWTNSFNSLLNELLFVASFLYTVNVYWLLGIFSLTTLGLMNFAEFVKNSKLSESNK